MNKVEFKYNIGEVVKYSANFDYKTVEGVAKISDISLKKAENKEAYLVLYKLKTIDHGEQSALENEIIGKLVADDRQEEAVSEG